MAFQYPLEIPGVNTNNFLKTSLNSVRKANGEKELDSLSFLKLVKEKSLEVTREIDEGLETIEVNIPAIVTCDLRLNEPRYASLPNIMKAKKKQLEQLNASNLGVDTKPRIEQIKVEEPPKRKAGIKVANVAELVEKLKNEAKVI